MKFLLCLWCGVIFNSYTFLHTIVWLTAFLQCSAMPLIPIQILLLLHRFMLNTKLHTYNGHLDLKMPSINEPELKECTTTLC